MDRTMLDLYTDYLICSGHYRTATGLSDLLEGAVSHDQVTRFLSQGEYGSKELWRKVKPLVREVETSDGFLIIDDTLEEKPYTDENEIVCWHFDHTQGKTVKGINLVSAVVRYGEVALPVGFEVVRKEHMVYDPKTGKGKRSAERSKNERFRDLIRGGVRNRLQYQYVLADSWYASQENMKYVRQCQNHFILALKNNRTVALSRKEKQEGKFQSISSLPLETGQAVQVYLKGLDFPVFLVKRVFTNKDGSTGILFLACSDLSLNGERIIKIYPKRWRIEEYHKSIKSNLGLEKSPTRTARTQNNHIFASLCAFAKLESLSFKHHLNHFALKYKLIFKATQMAWAELRKMAVQPT
jgi:hypothetical protein